MIETHDLTKYFGSLGAVQSVSFRVGRGEAFGLLGPNGAGKTTAIRMMLGIIEPDVGAVRLLGKAGIADALDHVGYLPEERGIYRRMTVRRALTFFAELKGVPPRVSAGRIAAWLERFELADRAEGRVENLSKGNQQKLQLIATLLHEPELIVLDEPFSGLDPINQQVFKDVMAELRAKGHTILFSTHMIDQAERACDHVCIIARGRKVVDGRVVDVKREHGTLNLAIEMEEWSRGAAEIVKTSPEVSGVREDGLELEVVLRPEGDAQAVLALLVNAGIALRRFERIEPSLEQIFLERVRRQTAQEPMEAVHA